MFDVAETLLVIPVITGLIQIIKMIPVFEDQKARVWLPFLSCAFGVVAGIILAFVVDHELSVGLVILHGIMLGLSASGLYSSVVAGYSGYQGARKYLGGD